MASDVGQPKVKNQGWRVTIAATIALLMLGALYAWSVVKKAVPEDWGWSEADKVWPYSTLPALLLRRDGDRRPHPGQTGPAHHDHLGWHPCRHRSHPLWSVKGPADLVHRLRRRAWHGYRVRLFVRHAAERQVVPGVENGSHLRHRGRRLRGRRRVGRTDPEGAHQVIRHPDDHDRLRHCRHRRHGGRRPVHQGSAARLRPGRPRRQEGRRREVEEGGGGLLARARRFVPGSSP